MERNKTMLVWKVVKQDRTSVIMNGQLTMHYSKGLTVKPKDRRFPLLAFKTLEDARKMVIGLNTPDLSIIKCEATRSRSKIKRLARVFYDISYSVNELLDILSKNLNTFALFERYPATILCSSITPLE